MPYTKARGKVPREVQRIVYIFFRPDIRVIRVSSLNANSTRAIVTDVTWKVVVDNLVAGKLFSKKGMKK